MAKTFEDPNLENSIKLDSPRDIEKLKALVYALLYNAGIPENIIAHVNVTNLGESLRELIPDHNVLKEISKKITNTYQRLETKEIELRDYQSFEFSSVLLQGLPDSQNNFLFLNIIQDLKLENIEEFCRRVMIRDLSEVIRAIQESLKELEIDDSQISDEIEIMSNIISSSSPIYVLTLNYIYELSRKQDTKRAFVQMMINSIVAKLPASFQMSEEKLERIEGQNKTIQENWVRVEKRRRTNYLQYLFRSNQIHRDAKLLELYTDGTVKEDGSNIEELVESDKL